MGEQINITHVAPEPLYLKEDLSRDRLNAEVPSLSSNYVSPEHPFDTLAPNAYNRGKVVTFYSYKGGVGRSRALANVALQLAMKGSSVLCLDFDLEAPGLSSYFSGEQFTWGVKNPDSQPGLLDMLCSHRDSLFSRIPRPPLQWNELVQRINIYSRDVHLDFIGPGRQDADYKQKICNFDWRSFYESWDGGSLIERLRKEFTERYNYVLIDSRTGITDISGICTVQLPDILVAVFTPGPQSHRGLVDALGCIETNRREIRQDAPFYILPLPCRVDRDVVREAFDSWFDNLLDSYFSRKVTALGARWTPEEYFRRVAIEHFSRFVYEDTLESLVHSVSDEMGNAWKYGNLIEVIESLGRIQLLPTRISFSQQVFVAAEPVGNMLSVIS